jgi:radical SAM superfamily enzyme YgiQ (UPF0313 family)
MSTRAPLRVCLVRPPSVEAKSQMAAWAVPPLGLAYVAAAIVDAGHQVTVVDAVGEDPLRLEAVDERLLRRGLAVEDVAARVPADTDVIGVSCMFSQEWPWIRPVVEALRARCPDALIVAGGEHVTALPEFVMQDSPIDVCVLGEGEDTIVDLLDALQVGRPLAEVPGLMTKTRDGFLRTAPRARLRNIDDIPLPLWDAFPLETYIATGMSFGVPRGRTVPMMATRGCPYQCTFCSSPDMWTTRWLARDPARVLDEIRSYIERYRIENVDFYDLTAIIKREWILEFCRLIKQSGLRFTWQLPSGTRSEAIDADVAKALYETGCRNIAYAPESGSPTELRRIKKKVVVPRMLGSMRAAARHGLRIKANIVVGFPGQTGRELLQTIWFMVKVAAVGGSDIAIHLYSPYPGSQLYRELRDQGRLPPPGDEYFRWLFNYLDLAAGESMSFSEHLSNRQIALARYGGTSLFYAVSLLLRPWRIFLLAYHLGVGRYETVLESGLARFVGRRRQRRARPVEVVQRAATVPAAPSGLWRPASRTARDLATAAAGEAGRASRSLGVRD